MKDWCLEVWGDYACFTRPEMKVERVSYDLITPSAARAIYESILWKPAIRWNITRIEVLNPIKWISVRRNEVGKKFSGPAVEMLQGGTGKPLGFFIEDERQQRAGLFLRDVRYRLHAFFDFIPPADRKTNRSTAPEFWADTGEEQEFVRADEKDAKYAAMFERRAKKGQCFHRPYLGCREFACEFRLINNGDEPQKPISETRELGWMLYDMNFTKPDDPTPMFFKAKLENGIVKTDRREVEVRG
ncbi:MAG: type I-C CRISPR-associated protein Cas5c [Chitinivibrionales bacterium]|nr:type I-C CRISPR-associated protein Cas5c [Chitinivibrionales bacterium]